MILTPSLLVYFGNDISSHGGIIFYIPHILSNNKRFPLAFFRTICLFLFYFSIFFCFSDCFFFFTYRLHHFSHPLCFPVYNQRVLYTKILLTSSFRRLLFIHALYFHRIIRPLNFSVQHTLIPYTELRKIAFLGVFSLSAPSYLTPLF